ncbi:hypothetical protein SAMN05444392_102274 [Seinonella peptonophila]|uniref:Uncharacterized protein n=1 Tax=Seinonella peptonophila TaxID=112248 RepID=A0A1M4VBA1_9BACL|nr:hypothetical protein [Seinonella peptonophila]SHE66216.1 hypothetical protein SAMN05444392_102274 [Seinonella peptonophila]
MARTAITVGSSTDAGIDLSLTTPIDNTNGMQFVNTGREVFVVENTGGSSITVTLPFQDDQFGRGGQKVVSVSAGTTKVIGPFHPDLYNHEGSGLVYIDFSANTGTVQAIKVSL